MDSSRNTWNERKYNHPIPFLVRIRMYRCFVCREIYSLKILIMEEMKKNNFSWRIRKKITSLLFGALAIMLLTGSIRWADAAVSWNIGHTLSWANSNSINLSNSGAYQVGYNLSGTLDIGDTLRLTATDGSGNTTTWSFVSVSWWESSGTILMNLNGSFTEWFMSFSGIVYTWGLANQVVASGMTLAATLDTHPPIMSLVGSGTMTLTQWVIYSESWAIWTDAIDGTGFLAVSNSWVVNTAIVGDYVLEYWKMDMAGNTSSHVSRTIHIVPALDTIAPVVSVTSHLNNATVTGVPVLSGLVSDTGGIANVKVNGILATLGSWTWSESLTSLSQWANILTVIATDLAGNTGSTSITLNRVSLPSNIGATLSGTTSAVITFSTDFSATGVVRSGTGAWFLDIVATGSNAGTSHTFILTGLLVDTDYYFTVEGQWGQVSAVQHFKTPFSIDNTASGTITVNGPVYLSGSSATGVLFSGSGSIHLLSTDPVGNSLVFPLNGLQIVAVWWGWDGIISPPERTNQSVSTSLSGYAFTGNAYQIGNSHTELFFSGQLATVSVDIGTALSGQTIKVFRSINQGSSYIDYTSCVVSAWWDCIFTTDHLSLFAFAMPADTVPDVFSFSSLTNTELATQYTSNTIIVSGITGQTAISVSGWEYSINGASFTTVTGVAHLGDSIILRILSAASYSTSNNMTLTIGWVAWVFSVTTKSTSSSWGGVVTGPGDGWGGGGGSSADVCIGGDFSPTNYDRLCLATAGNIITGIVAGSFNIPAVFINNIADVKFRDINNDWARDYILRLVTRGIIDNSNFYRGDDGLTRAEFLKIVIRTTGWELPQSGISLPFRDVVSESWYEPYVSVALTKWLIRNAQYFRPHDAITRAEATKILMVALGVTVSEPSTMTFVDVNKSSDLAKYIEAAKFLNILSGQMRMGQHIFRPNDNITRSEIAKVVANAFGL